MMLATQVDRLGGELLKIVMARIEAGRLTVPSPPASVARCMPLLRAPDFQAKKLVAQLEADPVLAALVMRDASAAAHGAPTKALEPAVARLGSERLRAIVVTYAANELFESNDPKINAANRKIWEHSLACALLARDLAAFAGSSEGEACYLAGLLHDVGKPVFAAMVLEAERKLGSARAGWMDHGAWTKLIGGAHRQIGVAVATNWGLAPEIAAAIRDCADYDAGDRSSAANIVRLANAIAKREGFITEPVAIDDIEAMIMVGRSMLGIEQELIERIAITLKQRVAQMVEHP